MFEQHHQFNKGTEFWLGRYYDTSNLCFSHDPLVEKFGDYIVSVFNDNFIKEELCTLIDKEFRKNFKCFRNKENIIDKNCFEDSKIFWDKKFKYIRLPNFKSEDIKNFELRISINPCLTNNCAMTKIYCNSLLHDIVDEKEIIDFYNRSRVLCESVISYITEIYSRNFFKFTKNKHIIQNNQTEADNFKDSFSLVSTVIGSDDKNTRKTIDMLRTKHKTGKIKRRDIKFFLSLIMNTNKVLDYNFLIKDYKWSYINTLDKNNQQNAAIIGYAEKEQTGHLVGLSDNIPRKILLPLHVKFIKEN